MAQASQLPAAKPLSIEDALKIALEKVPQEVGAILSAAVKKDLIALGTDEAFALRDSEGEIKAFKTSVTLTRANGGLIQPVPGGPHVVSAQGYEMWSEKAGACVIMPPEVLVDGQRKANPHVIRDEKNRRILAIYARAVAFRFSPMGLPMVSDWTTIFDNPSYRMIDLLSKAKKTPQAFRLLPKGDRPQEDGTWASYPFDESTDLWTNTAHPEALEWYGTIINREKKAIDFAQTFAKRNALKHLSGLQKAPGESWRIPVTAWRATGNNLIKWDATQYSAVQAKVSSIVSGDRKEFQQLEYAGGTERIDDEDGAAGLLSETDPEDQEGQVIDVEQNGTNGKKSDEGKGPDPQPEPEKPKAARPQLSAEDQKAFDNLATTAGMFKAEYQQAVKELGITAKQLTLSPANVEIAKKIMAKVNEIVDKQQ